MNRIKTSIREGVITNVHFKCPGCGDWHAPAVNGEKNSRGATWEFNGNFERPTLKPSLLVRSGHYVDQKHPCWCDYNKQHPQNAVTSCYICHSFITDGRIQFLPDCTHSLAGQTVDLLGIEDSQSL